MYVRLRLPEQVAGYDVMTIITCNCNPVHTSAIMVRVHYGSHQSVYLYNTMMSDNIWCTHTAIARHSLCDCTQKDSSIVLTTLVCILCPLYWKSLQYLKYCTTYAKMPKSEGTLNSHICCMQVRIFWDNLTSQEIHALLFCVLLDKY